MDIRKRINARKLLLSYLYQHCFFQKLSSEIRQANTDPDRFVERGKDPFFDQNFLVDLQDLRDQSSREGEIVQQKIQNFLQEDAEEELPYYLSCFFDQRKSDDVDGEYLALMIDAFSGFTEEAKKLINLHTDSFPYEQMEVCNQALFLLGFTEYHVMKTPKAVIINEMVELAKRYADEGAPKMIHAIFDKILSES